MADFGTDLACVTDITAEGFTVTGPRLLAEALVRRWMTPRGMLLDDPDYGTDLRENINEGVDELALVRMRSELRAEACKDERVLDVTVTSTTLTTSKTGEVTVTFTVAVDVVDGSAFDLVVAISSVTVALLKVEE